MIEFIVVNFSCENIDILKFGIYSLRIKLSKNPPMKIERNFIESLYIVLNRYEDLSIQVITFLKLV